MTICCIKAPKAVGAILKVFVKSKGTFKIDEK